MRSACLYRSGPDLGDRSPAFFWRRSLWSSLSGSSQLEVVSHNRHGCARVDVMSMAHKGVNCPRPPPLLTRVINDVTNPRTHYPRTPPTEHGRSGGSCAPKPPRTAAGQLLRVWPPATSSALAEYRRAGWIVIDPSVCSPWGFINGVLRQGNSLSGTCVAMPADLLQEAEFSSPADRRAAVLDAELAVHGALVCLHGIERNVEPLTDFASR